ncbi:hypothetical protein [Mesorhizobium sp. IMUNJ 23232]|uniref:hypothetical protein n=1 Tax=Mesorhizobium sp. IMUNJ 23232 TaxID=3376064 RepID=UPI0037AFB072
MDSDMFVMALGYLSIAITIIAAVALYYIFLVNRKAIILKRTTNRSLQKAESVEKVVKNIEKAVKSAQKSAMAASKSARLVAERAGWLTPQTAGGFNEDEIKAIDLAATLRSSDLMSQSVEAVAPALSGARIALGVGQSFMAGSASATRLNMVPDMALKDVTYRAKMLGSAERCHGDGASYHHYGSAELTPLTETLVRYEIQFSNEQRISGDYHPKARGATPLPTACITFEQLFDEHRRAAGASTEPTFADFDVAVNVARNELSLEHISGPPAIDRTKDAIRKAHDVSRAEFPDLPAGHSITFERHGQNNEGSSTPAGQYMTDHRAFRLKVNSWSREITGSDLPAPWIATQVSGAYGSPRRQTAAAQLSMALNDADYFLATPDYPFMHYGKAKEPHPRAGDRHPTANGTMMPAIYMAYARYHVQVLRRNWFPTHMGEAFFRGNFILVSFRAMVPPLRISPVCVSTTLTMIEALGFDVEDAGVPVRIVGAPELVGELTFRIQCARELKNPIVGLAKGSFGLAEIGAMGSGATNISDSQKLNPRFRPSFREGYTDHFAKGFVDDFGLEDLEDWYETFEFSNWAVAQRVRCKPMPQTIDEPISLDTARPDDSEVDDI